MTKNQLIEILKLQVITNRLVFFFSRARIRLYRNLTLFVNNYSFLLLKLIYKNNLAETIYLTIKLKILKAHFQTY